jgi:hypothetical protein
MAMLATIAVIHSGCSDAQEDASETAGVDTPGSMAVRPATSPCEPKLSGPGRPAGAPVDDIVGIRPGQSMKDASAILGCRGNMAELLVRTSDHGQTKLKIREDLIATSGEPCEQSYRQMRSDFGSRTDYSECQALLVEGSQSHRNRFDRFQVTLVGLPGQERVASVWRMQEFPEGKRPVRADLIQTLTAKYGEPSQVDDRGHQIKLSWVFDLRGRRMSTNNPAYLSCFGLNPDADSSQRWTAACGHTIAATVTSDAANSELARQLAMVSMNQADYVEAADAMKAALAERAARLQADEVERARENGAEVEL